MSSFLPLIPLFILSFVSSVLAQVDLGTFPNLVVLGETYTLNWTATANYSYALWLVQADTAGGYNDYDWTKVEGLAVGLNFSTLEGSYDWVVPSNLSTNESYALWLDGLSIPFDGGSYPTMTDWFTITSSNTSTSPTTSSSSPTVMTTSSSNSASDTPSHHHKTLSGRAIAGIVIGCLVAIALGIGASLFYIWRKKRSDLEKREAAARASRLAPVMQESSSAYEMHDRAPQP